MGAMYQPALDAAGAPVGSLAPTVNPTGRPLLRALGRKVVEETPAAGMSSTFDHFGIGGRSAAKDQPSAEADDLNFTTRIRAVPLRFLVQLPTEVEVAIPESVVGTGNGYGAAVAQVNPGFLPSALMWSALGFWGGTLVPHPGYVQSNFPTGPFEDNQPILSGAQADDVSTWGWFRSHVDGKGNDRSSAEGSKLTIPGLLSVGSIESTSEAGNQGDRITGQAVSLLKDVNIRDVVKIDAVKTVSSAEGTGAPEGRKTNRSVSLVGVRVGGVPVVLTGDGVTLAGAEAMPQPERAAREAELNAALESAGLALQAVPAQSGDSVSESGSTAAIAVAGLRIRFNRPDRPQLYQLDLGYAETSVFTGRRPAEVGFPAADGSSFNEGGTDHASGTTSEQAVLDTPSGTSAIGGEGTRPVGLGASGAPYADSGSLPTQYPGSEVAAGARPGPGGVGSGTARGLASLATNLPGATLARQLGSFYRGTALLALGGLVLMPLFVRRVLLRTPQN
jgi:hypothetical protein